MKQLGTYDWVPFGRAWPDEGVPFIITNMARIYVLICGRVHAVESGYKDSRGWSCEICEVDIGQDEIDAMEHHDWRLFPE